MTLAEAATVWAAKVLTAPGTGPQPVESVKAGVCTLSWDAHTRERFLGWVDQRRADRAEGEPSQAAARSAPGSGRDPPESTRERTPVSSGTLGPSAKQAELEASKLMSSWVDGSSHQLTPGRRAGGPPKGKGGKGPKGKGGKKGKSKDRRLEVDKALSRLLRHEAGTRDIPITADGWVLVRDALRFEPLRDLGVDEEQLRTAVANNNKSRISWYSGEDGDHMVAAWSGHTIPDVTGPGWRVPEADLPMVLVHGTYQRHVSSIKANGLLRTRRDLHFQDPECHQRRWRNDLEVKVTIDPRAASRNGCTFRRTGNGLYLSHESVPASCILGYKPWDNLVGGVDQRTAAASTGETKGLWPPSEPSSFKDEVAEVASKLAQVSLHDQEYLVVEAETLDTRAADREEVTKVLEEENCERASDLDWSADEEDLAVAQAEPGELDLDEPMGEALGEGSVARSAPGVRLDQPTVVSLQTGDSDEEEATPDWGRLSTCEPAPVLGALRSPPPTTCK